VQTAIIAELHHLPNVYCLTTTELNEYYPVSNYSDTHSETLGHIPYTPLFFTALGTHIIRKWFVLQNPPYKVIVLDCDETLWQGVCGEEGVWGIKIDTHHQFLQEFMVRQYHAGMLIALCSKNQEEDIIAVFAQRTDMQLKREHIVSWRINWQAKSENIRSLATELQLGLESFIFIDDNPVECAEVKTHCPQVFVLQLPEDKSKIRSFLNHLWVFDHLRVTTTDQQRTRFYQEAVQRTHLQQNTLTLAHFLASLQLKVTISPIHSQEIPRISQLTQRTNQFNFTTIRRSEGEIKTLLHHNELEGLAITVSDRFGDYGLVGTLLFRVEKSLLIVDTFLLSCRALGRGIEYQMLAELGKIALNRQLNHIQVTYLATPKNQPAFNFLQHIGENFKQLFENQFIFHFPAEYLATIVYQPTEPVQTENLLTTPIKTVTTSSVLEKFRLMQRIATELNTVDAIFAQMNAKNQKRRPETIGRWSAPFTPIEKQLAQLWCEVLGITEIGVHDHFFTLGGNSLTAVRLISRIREQLNVSLSIEQLFNQPMVANLALIILEQKLQFINKETTQYLLQQVHQFSEQELPAFIAKNSEEPLTITTTENTQQEPSFSIQMRLVRDSTPPRDTTTQITTIGFVTRNRLKGLQQAMTSYIDHNKQYDRKINFTIMDDSNRADTRHSYQQMLTSLVKQHNLTISYAGWGEKYYFAKKLMKTEQLPEEVINFALFDPERCGYAAGANRNALLLQTIGETFLSVDDDTLCHLAAPTMTDHRLGFTMNQDPAEITFFPNRTTLLQAINPINADVLSFHEQALGRNLADLLATKEVDLSGINAPLLQRLMNGQGRILVTLNGLFGDCGWGAPFGYWDSPMGCLLLESNSHQRLTCCETDYRKGCISREVLRLAKRLTISDATFSMSTFMGLDHRALLPPYFPVQRGQDILFGMTVWQCFKSSYFAHLPVALLHTPVEQRHFWPDEIFRTASGSDTAKLMVYCLRTFQQTNHADDIKNLQALGQHLMDLGSMSLSDFIYFFQVQAKHHGHLLIELMERRLSEEEESPAFWANDIKKYMQQLQQAFIKPNYWLPLDLMSGRTIDEVQILSQKLVYQFGQLLYWWPTLVGVTKELYLQGEHFAKDLGSL